MSHPALIIQKSLDLIHVFAKLPIWNWPQTMRMWRGLRLGTLCSDNKTKTNANVIGWLRHSHRKNSRTGYLKEEKRYCQQCRQQRGCGCLKFCWKKKRTQEVQSTAAGKCLGPCEIVGVPIIAKDCLCELLLWMSVHMWAACPSALCGLWALAWLMSLSQELLNAFKCDNNKQMLT